MDLEALHLNGLSGSTADGPAELERGPEIDRPQEITSNLRGLTNTRDIIRQLSWADVHYQEELARRAGVPFDRDEHLSYAITALSDLLLHPEFVHIGEEADYWTGLVERSRSPDTQEGIRARRPTVLDRAGGIFDQLKDDLKLVGTLRQITNKSKEEIEATLEKLGYSPDEIRKIESSIGTTVIIGVFQAVTFAAPLIATFIDSIVAEVNNPQITAAILPASFALNLAGMGYHGYRIIKGLRNPRFERSLNIALTGMHFPLKDKKLHDPIILGFAFLPQIFQLVTGLLALWAGERGITYAVAVNLLNSTNQITQGFLTLILEKIADYEAGKKLPDPDNDGS